MAIIRPWAFWRRVQYGTGFGVLGVLFVSMIYYHYLYTPPNCFDNLQNGSETGTDCGGGCVRICAAEIIPPQVQWVKSFKIVDGQYNALAYVENRNQVASTPELHYTFTFLDDSGGVITERSGTTVLPPNSVYPIFEGRITTDRAVARTDITLTPAELWLPAAIGRDQFVSSDIDLFNIDVSPRLEAMIENTALQEAQNVEVVATIFNRDGEPETASQTFVDIFPPRSTERVIFTWPEPISKTVRSCDIATDAIVAIDLSGSMNNDGGVPPEPISSVLAAASSFASEFRSQDQLGVVTFATEAMLALPLTNDSATAVATIAGLTIDPAEEAGSTNTGAALAAALAELNSSRHNDNARKVVILLTDGLATAPDEEPEAYAQQMAEELQAAGVEVYTIGLGNEVNMVFLRELADSPQKAYKAVTTSELATIYSGITSAICEEGPSRIDILPKTDTNFTPLR